MGNGFNGLNHFAWSEFHGCEKWGPWYGRFGFRYARIVCACMSMGRRSPEEYQTGFRFKKKKKKISKKVSWPETTTYGKKGLAGLISSERIICRGLWMESAKHALTPFRRTEVASKCQKSTASFCFKNIKKTLKICSPIHFFKANQHGIVYVNVDREF